MRPLRKLAIKLNLVDRPNQRKIHHNPVPLVGGLGLTISSGLSLMVSFHFWNEVHNYYALIIGIIILLIIGVIDDKMEVKPLLKLIVQIALAYFVFHSGIRLESMFGILGIHELSVEIQCFLTLVVIVGVINAINLMDGIDGLAAGFVIIGLLALTYIALSVGSTFLATLYVSIIGGLIGFLRFNLSTHNKIFMGDAGALILGFILVVSSIMLIQSAHNTYHISTTLAIVSGVLILPVVDSLRVYRKRIKNGYSPFRADRTHFHHLILAFGIKHKKASFMIVLFVMCIIILNVIFGIMLNLTLTIFSSFIFCTVIFRILVLNLEQNIWHKKIKDLEDCDPTP